MKKILFIHHAKGWGGAPLNMINVINALDKSKFSVEVLLIKDSVVSKYLEKNHIPYKIATSKFYKSYYNYYTHTEAGFIKWFQFYRLLKSTISWILSKYYFAPRELKNFEYDIVHLNSSVLTDWLKPCSKKGKVIYHIQEPITKGTFGLRHKFFRKQVNKHADKIIAISKDNAQRIGLPEKTEVIYNYAKIPENAPPDRSYHSKKFLYLGGAAYIKGFFTMAEALDYLDKDVKVIFGGGYTVKNKSRNIIKRIIKFILHIGVKRKAAIQKLRNHPKAEIIGLTNDVDKYLDEVCCLISPFSVSHFSRPVIEAYLHKKPAIGSDVSGMEEIIDHNVTGLIFKKDNPKELAGMINYLANNPEKTKKLGENAYAIAINKFTPENISQFVKIYKSLKYKY